MKNGTQVTRIIHSVIYSDELKYLFLADQTSFYMVNVRKKKFTSFKNQNCISMFLLDGNYVYTLSHSSTKTKILSGLRLYDIK